jgi:hypothetical protein
MIGCRERQRAEGRKQFGTPRGLCQGVPRKDLEGGLSYERTTPSAPHPRTPPDRARVGCQCHARRPIHKECVILVGAHVNLGVASDTAAVSAG